MRQKINSLTALVLIMGMLLVPVRSYSQEIDEFEQRLESTVEPEKEDLVKYKKDQIRLEKDFVLNLQKLDAKLFCVAQNNFFEARGESLLGKIAVAEVVRNRTTNINYPSDVCAVVRQVSGRTRTKICQFSWFCKGTGKIPLFARSGKINEQVYKQWYDSVVAAVLVDRGEEPDVTNGATHFYAHKIVSPSWRSSLRKAIVIGNHTFMGPRIK